MDLWKDNILQEIVKLESVRRLQASAISATKYGTIVGITTIVSGIFGGPVGLSIGGVVSSLITGYKAYGSFKSVPDIMNKMTLKEKERLADLILAYAKKHAHSIPDFIRAVTMSSSLEQELINILVIFFAKELSMCVNPNAI